MLRSWLRKRAFLSKLPGLTLEKTFKNLKVFKIEFITNIAN